MIFVNNINMYCNPQVCSNVDWGGNPDIAGIGVSIYQALFEKIHRADASNS